MSTTLGPLALLQPIDGQVTVVALGKSVELDADRVGATQLVAEAQARVRAIGGPGTGLKITARDIVFRSPCRSSKSCVNTARHALLPGGTSFVSDLPHIHQLLDVRLVVLPRVDAFPEGAASISFVR
jgi:hypothetical protein